MLLIWNKKDIAWSCNEIVIEIIEQLHFRIRLTPSHFVACVCTVRKVKFKGIKGINAFMFQAVVALTM